MQIQEGPGYSIHELLLPILRLACDLEWGSAWLSLERCIQVADAVSLGKKDASEYDEII